LGVHRGAYSIWVDRCEGVDLSWRSFAGKEEGILKTVKGSYFDLKMKVVEPC
jgi:hypothetical protein